MNIGKLRHRVTIQQQAQTRDEYGGVVTTWQTFADRWAAIEPLSGRELFAAQQLANTVSIRVRLRYLAGVTPAMRVLYGTRTFSIQAVINVEERNEELQLLCEEVV